MVCTSSVAEDNPEIVEPEAAVAKFAFANVPARSSASVSQEVFRFDVAMINNCAGSSYTNAVTGKLEFAPEPGQ